jgi:hypothetical protein
MSQQSLFFESVYDALNAVVIASGGFKKVGAELWPQKDPHTAATDLRHSLEPSRREKLDPEQFLYLLKVGKANGCDLGMYYTADDVGYSRPSPLTEEQEEIEIRDDLRVVSERLKRIEKRMDRCDAFESNIRAV